MVAGGVGLAPFATLAEALRARGVPMTLFYGGRGAEDLFYIELFERRRTARPGDRGRQARRARPRHRSARARRSPGAVDRRDRALCVRPEPMLAAVARMAAHHGVACEVSVEQVMGCGLGGCYSCVVPVRGSEGARTSSARASTARCSTRPRIVWECSRMTWISPSRIGSLDAQEPAHRRERLLRLRRRVRATSSTCRRSAASPSRAVPDRARRPPAAADRRDPRRHAERDRPAGHRRAPVRAREAARAARPRRAIVIVNVCGTTLDEYVEVARILSDAEGVAAIELNISCPNIKEGGIQFGCSLTGTFDVVSAVRKVDDAAGHPEADAERDRRGVVRARGRRGRRRRRVARQHVPRDGHRRRDAPARSSRTSSAASAARPSGRSPCAWSTSAASR